MNLPQRPSEEKSRHPYSATRRWLFLAVMALASIAAAADQQLISVVLEPIKTEFHLSDQTVGLLAGFAFAACLAVSGIPLGRLADRGDRRLIISLSMAGWSLMTVLSGLATSFWTLFVARVGVGIGEAGSGPAIWSLVTDYFPEAERPRTNGILYASASMGAFAAYAAGVQLAASLGWRGAFLGFGILGVLFAPLCWLILREPRRSVRGVSLSNPQERSSSALRALSKKRSFVGICLASIIYNIAAAGDVVFGVSYLTRVLKLDVTVYGTILGFVVAGATLVGSAGGGAVLAVLSRRDPAWLVKAPALVVILSVPVIAWGYLATEPALYFTSYFILMAGIAALAPGIISALQMVAGSNRRAMAFATLTLLVTLFGQGLGPPIVGAISDYLSAEWGPAEGLRYALLLSAMLYIPAGIVFWIAGNSVVRDTEA